MSMTTGSATLSRVKILNNTSHGISPEGGTVIIREAVITGNGGAGMRPLPWAPGVSVAVTVERSLVSANLASGVAADGSSTRVVLIGTIVSDNGGDGVVSATGATLIAFGNTVTGNVGLGFLATAVFKSAGNNTLSDNNSGGPQVQGSITPLVLQ